MFSYLPAYFGHRFCSRVLFCQDDLVRIYIGKFSEIFSAVISFIAVTSEDQKYFSSRIQLPDIIKERLQKKTSMGFNAELKDTVEHDEELLSKVTIEDLRKFGMIPEFLGRLPIVFTLKGLDKEMLVKILKEPKNAILKQYQKLLALDEVKLEFDDSALEAIAEKAMEKDTGARALRAIIEEFMLDIMYEIPKDDNIGEVTITRAYIEGTGGPVIQLRGQAVPRLDG